MDENLTSVNAGQESVEGSQTVETTVSEVTANTGAKDAEPAEQQTTEATEKAPQTKEENAKIAEVRRSYEAKMAQMQKNIEEQQAARDKQYAALGYTKGDGTPIATEAEYYQELAAQQQISNLTAQGMTEDAARLKVENDQLKAKVKETETAKLKEQTEAAERSDFFSLFKKTQERDFSEKDAEEIFKSPVFLEARAAGKSLGDAYQAHLLQSLLAEKRGVANGKKTAEANAANSGTSTGSFAGKGAAENSALSDEIINAMSDKQRAERWPEIKKFYGMK